MQPCHFCSRCPVWMQQLVPERAELAFDQSLPARHVFRVAEERVLARFILKYTLTAARP